jgi:hypothetical protein
MSTADIIGLILSLVQIAPDLINRLGMAANQSGELSDAEWQALKDRADALFASPAWQPDPTTPAGG